MKFVVLIYYFIAIQKSIPLLIFLTNKSVNRLAAMYLLVASSN